MCLVFGQHHHSSLMSYPIDLSWVREWCHTITQLRYRLRHTLVWLLHRRRHIFTQKRYRSNTHTNLAVLPCRNSDLHLLPGHLGDQLLPDVPLLVANRHILPAGCWWDWSPQVHQGRRILWRLDRCCRLVHCHCWVAQLCLRVGFTSSSLSSSSEAFFLFCLGLYFLHSALSCTSPDSFSSEISLFCLWLHFSYLAISSSSPIRSLLEPTN